MPPAPRLRAWDDYFIPGTLVLRNKFTAPGKPYGEPDADALRTMEERATLIRTLELFASRIHGRFDYDHLKAIHHHMFQDVYEWAGQERTAPVGQFMTKDGHAYCGAGPHLTAAAEDQFARLAHKNLLRGLGREEFVVELAEAWGELNVIHPFREGNTRAQFVFFSWLAEQWRLRVSGSACPACW
jgi:cell filamentation protein